MRELTKLGEEGCDTLFQVNDNELNAGTTEASLEELKQSRPKSRIDKLLRESIIEPSSISKSKKVTLRFMLNPVKFIADHDDPAKLGSILCEKCQLQGEAFQQVAVGTGEMEEIPANMVRDNYSKEENTTTFFMFSFNVKRNFYFYYRYLSVLDIKEYLCLEWILSCLMTRKVWCEIFMEESKTMKIVALKMWQVFMSQDG